MATVLDEELRTYEAHRDNLLGRARGQFVLIKNDRIIDVFASREDAIRRGYREFGNQPFLVKEVVDVEMPLHFTSFEIRL